MIYKLAVCSIKPLIIANRTVGLVKTASGGVLIEPNSEKARIIEAEIDKHPTALFFRSKAIVADEANSNGDFFSIAELLDSYKSFEGVPFFTNHDNQNVENARGKVIFAEWVPEEKAIYTISFVDREAYPHICRSIEEEYITGVSMGCSVEYSICNLCENKAEKVEDYCPHIKERKGRRYSGKVRNVNTGEVKKFKNELVFEYNYGIKFIELSAVVDPACSSCRIDKIITNDDYVRKVANIENKLHMVKNAAILKEAGQEEIDQLNQVLTTLEQIAVQLIQNRQQIEVDFASDLVSILSELQTFVDELGGAGYGNIQSVPGVSPDQMGEAVPGVAPEQAGIGAAPMAEESALGVGEITGSPTAPAVSGPQLPISAPTKPLATNLHQIQRIANSLFELKDKLYKKAGENDMSRGRTIEENKRQKNSTMEVLSNSWKEKQDFLQYIKKMPSMKDDTYTLSINKGNGTFLIVASREGNDEMKTWSYEDLTDAERSAIKESPRGAALHFLDTYASSLGDNITGDTDMADNIKEAGATSVNKQPDQVQERQLDQERALYHPRTEEERNSVTQKQLDTLRKGEFEVVTEVQLENEPIKMHPRTGEERDQVQEGQLKEVREDDEKNTVTQDQLDKNNNRVDEDIIDVTERQLDKLTAPWERAAGRDESLFKTAGEHMKAVTSAIADSVIATGCTPQEACKVAGSLVNCTKNRYQLLEAIQEVEEDKNIDYRQRLSFWSGKIKIASADRKDIAEMIIKGLKRIAGDTTINPEVIIDAMDVIAEGNVGATSITKQVEEKLAQTEEEPIVNRKDELRSALQSSVVDTTEDERNAEREGILASTQTNKQTRESERSEWEESLNEVTYIETSFTELGCEKDSPDFRPAIKSFTRGALAANNIKLSAITNVTISGETVTIAVQTDEGEESIEIPTKSGGAIEGEIPEGDFTGEGLESGLDNFASKKNKMTREAQSPMGGGIPGTPGENAGGPGDPSGGMPDVPPAGTDPVQALTTDEADIPDEIPTAGEQQPLGSICPECGSSDVDVESSDDGGIKGTCKNPECGAGYDALVKKNIEYKITKPSKLMSGEAPIEDIEGPEIPALPVAAQTRLNKDVMTRIASNQEKHGHVCPACGMTQCKASKEEMGHSEYTCPACGTDVAKDFVVNVNEPDQGFLRVKWDLVPDLENCPDCKQAATEFMSMIKVGKLMKEAEEASSEFPMANCIERIARQYGGNSVATFGPCKGKPLADCVCGQLQSLGLRKVRHMERLANVYIQEDPMDRCIKDQMEQKYDEKEATSICNCLRKKFASEVDKNVFIEAFEKDIEEGREKVYTKDDLTVVAQVLFEDEEPEMPVDDFEDVDIGADLPPEDIDIAEDDPGEEVVTIDIPKETAEEIVSAIEVAIEEPIGDEVGVEEPLAEETPVPPVETETPLSPEEERDMALAMQTHKLRRVGESVVKIAATPKKIEHIEKDVEAGVPRAKATMGEEGAANIDVPMAKPSVPRSKATMGHEGPDNIDVKAPLPDYPVDNAYMGHEKEIQQGYEHANTGKGMPAINNEIKGTVIATTEDGNLIVKPFTEQQIKEAKKMKEVDTVEKDVEAGVPRAKATMGEEGADNIDVPMAKPSVPRSNATMGHEGPDNINVKAPSPDVPIDSAYMGHEKEIQQGYDHANSGKGMPGINNEMLKQVQMNHKQELQLERIANARKMKAVEVSSKLLATSRITEEAYEDIVEALSKFELDKIASVADKMYPRRIIAQTETPIQQSASVHSGPAIVMASKSPEDEETFVDKLSSMFTIGNHQFDEKLTIYGEK